MGSRHPLLPAYVLSAVALVAAALGSLVFMETATVKVSVPTSKITANRTITGGPSGRELATTRIEASVTDSRQGSATNVLVPAKWGSGTVEFYCSPSCPKAEAVTARTVVSNSANWEWTTQAPITVGPGPTHVSVAVISIDPGPGGNTAANTINKIDTAPYNPVPNPSFPNVHVVNPAPTTGGAPDTTGQVVQQSDLDGVHAALTAQVTQDLDAALSAQAGGLKFIPDGKPTLTAAADHKVGDKVATFTMTMTATLGAVAFSEGQADALLRATIAQKVPKSFRLTSDPIQTSYVLTQSSSNGNVTLKGSATGVILPNITAAELKSRIKGMRVEAARQQLSTLGHGTAVEIIVKPAVPWLPVIQDHIAVTIVLEPTAV